MLKLYFSLMLTMLSFLGLGACSYAQQGTGLEALELPPGFVIEIYARLPGARSLAVDPATGDVFIGTRALGSVYRIDGETQEATRLDGFDTPNGVAVADGRLFVAEPARVISWPLEALAGLQAPTPLEQLPEPTTVYEGLPSDELHGWRYLKAGPDGKLYLTVGAPCNICEPEDPQGTLLRFGLDGSNPEVYAQGVRNSVGLDFQPGSGALYFTDNGADKLGDNFPPDELNHASEPGEHFGFPYYGGAEVLPDYAQASLPQSVPPALTFDAHSAALGVAFYSGEMFPEDYQGDAFVAQHGSWNRSEPTGYRLMRVRFEAGKPVSSEVFASGWLTADGSAWGRPVDVAPLADGSLLLSDDLEGVVYRITYN